MGTRNVASAKSNGNSGSMPCTIKYGESLVDFNSYLLCPENRVS